MDQKLKIGYIQMTCSQNKSENIEKASVKLADLASRGAHVVCMQELFTSRYFCYKEDNSFFALAEKIPGDTVTYFQELAKKYNLVLILSIFEQRTKGLYHNTAVVINADGSLQDIYRKSHIPDDPGFYEKFYFSPGDTGYKVFDTKYAKIGTLVCWDQWYPEAARITSLMGADIIFYPTAIGWDINEKDKKINIEQLQAWQTIQRAHAIANGVFIVAVNRVGEEEETKFWGNSFICNPFGTVLYNSPEDEEDSPVIEIDINDNLKYRNIWPFLRDRRIDNYDQILKRFID